MTQSFGLSGSGTYVDVLRFRSGVTIISDINQNTTAESSIISSSGESKALGHERAPSVPGPAEEKREVEDAVIRVARE